VNQDVAFPGKDYREIPLVNQEKITHDILVSGWIMVLRLLINTDLKRHLAKSGSGEDMMMQLELDQSGILL